MDQLNQFLEQARGELIRAVHYRKHPFRYLTLATSDGIMPDARMVVLRDFDALNMTLNIFTDRRSNKIQQLFNNPNAIALFWHPRKRLQVKVGISMSQMGEQESQAYFKQLPTKARESYNTKDAPGTRTSTYEDSIRLKSDFTAEDFVVLQGEIYEMECLQLGSDHHHRASFHFHKGRQLRSFWLVP
jgi:hypothetical protein